MHDRRTHLARAAAAAPRSKSQTTDPEVARRTLLTAGRICLGVGLLAVLLASGLLDWRELQRLGTEWPLASVALVLLAGSVILTSWRFQVVLRARGRHLPLRASVRLTLIGAFFNTFLPGSTGGDGVRMFYAATSNRPRGTEIATLVLMDRVVGVQGLLILPLLMAPLSPNLIRSMPWLRSLLAVAGLLAALLLIGTALLLRDGAAHRWLHSALAGRGTVGEHARRAIDTVGELRHSPRALLIALGISLLTQGTMVAVMMILLAVTSGSTPPPSVAILVPFGLLANSLPITPGGLGVGEGAFAVLLASVGAGGGAAALLAWRVLTTLIDLSGAVFYLTGRTDMATSPVEIPSVERFRG